MTTDDLDELFEKHEDEFLKFERVEMKRSSRHDIHAFLLLAELFPGEGSIICHAEHDEIWLDGPTQDELPANFTEETVIELHRSGVRWSGESFCMFV